MTTLGPRLQRLPADTMAALSFFSRLPVSAPAGSFDMHQVAGAWPAAGFLLALLPAVLFELLRAADFPAPVAALAALAGLALLTGALHEDGLSDTADGFGGGHTRDEKLAIMRDSRLGTFGALALLFVLLGKLSALSAIGLQPGFGGVALLAAAMLSRSMALWYWNSTMPARSDGLARSAGRPDWLSLALGLILGLVAGVALLIAFGLSAVLAILLAVVGVRLFSSLCRRQIGGHTGDTIGAAQQIAEALVLVGVTAGASL
jgi:adenosylcobinamide-GDP ribazoletransferase